MVPIQNNQILMELFLNCRLYEREVIFSFFVNLIESDSISLTSFLRKGYTDHRSYKIDVIGSRDFYGAKYKSSSKD